ncbi:MAG: SDR family oxidoreductase [Lentisphaeria bacterium]|nr:SDR family oxidoreductase [Lentisphaeria bacterium]
MNGKKKILVTGGAGFIGSNLVEALLAMGCQIRVLDNFSTGKRENLDFCKDNPDFELLEGDIRNYDSCTQACKNIDYVFHQAALGSVPRSIKNPIESTDVNIGGFVKVLTAAKECGVKKFIYAASSSTYGDSLALPKVEERIGKPLSPYAITKYVDELFAENFAALYGIDTIGLRYFNVFGRRQSPDGAYAAVIPKFASSLVKHQAPTINGDGSNSRDFTHIDNVISANILAMESTKATALNQVYNVACGESISLNELFATLRNELSKFDPKIAEIEPVYGPERVGDVKKSLASIDKISEKLNYKVIKKFSEGIKDTAEYYFKSL